MEQKTVSAGCGVMPNDEIDEFCCVEMGGSESGVVCAAQCRRLIVASWR